MRFLEIGAANGSSIGLQLPGVFYYGCARPRTLSRTRQAMCVACRLSCTILFGLVGNGYVCEYESHSDWTFLSAEFPGGNERNFVLRSATSPVTPTLSKSFSGHQPHCWEDSCQQALQWQRMMDSECPCNMLSCVAWCLPRKAGQVCSQKRPRFPCPW
jgi:hypothetical protein